MAQETPLIAKPVWLGRQINWGHPLSRGLICAYASRGHEAARNQMFLRASGTYAGSSGLGWATHPSDAAPQTPSYDKTLDDALVAGEISIVTSLYLPGPSGPSGAVPQVRVGYFTGASDAEQYGFVYVGTDNDLVFFAARNSPTTNWHVLDANVQFPHASVLGATWKSTTSATVYKNGISLGDYASTAPVADTRVRVTVAPSTANGQFQFVYIWNRRLTDSEHAWLAREPYALWKQEQPRQRLFRAGAASYSGTGAFTSAASSLSGTADLLFSGTGALEGAAPSLDATADLAYVGSGAVTTAAASLDILGQLQYNGSVAWTSAASAYEATGTVAVTEDITGIGAISSAAASIRAKGRRRLKAGHDLVDLARYNAFVEQAEPILEELGQTPQPTGATAPVLAPPPTIHPEAPADYREFLAQALSTLQVAPVVLPALTVTGKSWIRGHVGLAATPIWMAARGGLTYQGASHFRSPEAHLAATGHVDNYYTIRRDDDLLMAQFIQSVLLGHAV
jgi:hypothetical protein